MKGEKGLNKTINPNGKDALLVTDIQIDFLPGGALPVTNGDKIIPVINNYIKRFESAKAYVIASRDWHPLNHKSFKKQGGPWPPHCVQETTGAKFSPQLKLHGQPIVISKATDPKHEAYSAFDNTNLHNTLQQLGVERLFVTGLATDYCVVNTVLGARELGYDTIVLSDATLGINVQPGDVDRAFEAMQKKGASLLTEADFTHSEDNLPLTTAEPDILAQKPTMMDAAKKKAKMRSKGAGNRIKTERG